MTTSIGSSILTSLGAGSGIDTSSLVSSLVSAAKEPRQTVITNQQTLNNARISAVASAISSLDTFANALTQVLSGSDYVATPASNNSDIASVSSLTGGTPTGLPASLTVEQLATARVLASSSVSGATSSSAVGTGSLTITTAAGKTATINITSGNDSYSGLASAINAAGIGVTARVVTDANGTRLVFKGDTGAANDFSISASADDSSSALAGLSWSGTDSSTISSSSSPQNAKITLDGVTHEYASNTVDDAIQYMRIDLNKASPGTTVTLSMTQPTGTMADLLKEYVDAYNTLMKALNTATSQGTDSSTAGVLNGVSSVRDMKYQLAAITSTQLSSTGTYKTLADIGVTTNRDGTLTLDSTALSAAMAADPQGVVNMLNPTTSTTSNPGLSSLMDKVRTNIEQDNGPLKLTQSRYQALADQLTQQMDKLDTQMTDYQAQLTKVYSAMETRLSAIKATQSYLDQQVALWTKSGN